MKTVRYSITVLPVNEIAFEDALDSLELNFNLANYGYGYTNSVYEVDLTIDDLTVLYLKVPIIKHVSQRKVYYPRLIRNS